VSAVPDWWTEAVHVEEAEPVEDGITVPKRLPPWTASLPTVEVAGTVLDADRTSALLFSAMRGKAVYDLGVRPIAAAARERMTTAERDRIGVALLRGWLDNGAKGPHRALFLAAGYLGADGLVDELAPLVRDWPAQKLHQRAELGLVVLAATGVEAAVRGLMTASGAPYENGWMPWPLQDLASQRGLTVDDLRNLAVGDAGLDEAGETVLDYGSRRFRLTAGPDARARVQALDDTGRPSGPSRTSLPASTATDDPAAVEAAKKQLAAFRKELTAAAKKATVLLEGALRGGRTWSLDDHRTHVVAHPVTRLLARTMVWEVTAPDGARELVRLDEDGAYLTVDERVHEPAAGSVVRLPHPLHLTDDELASWRAHLGDHELAQPVEQLDRAALGLPDDQPDGAIDLVGLPEGELDGLTLLGVLEKHGWKRDAPDDDGIAHELDLDVADREVAVTIEVTGLDVRDRRASPPQRVLRVTWARTTNGVILFSGSAPDAHRLPWSEADPVVVSEVRRSLAALQERITP